MKASLKKYSRQTFNRRKLLYQYQIRFHQKKNTVKKINWLFLMIKGTIHQKESNDKDIYN